MDTLTIASKASIVVTGGKTRDFASPSYVVSYTKSIPFTLGTGAGKANKVFDDYRTLTTGANESLDFSGGGLVDAFGDAVTFTKIRGVYIENTHASQTLTIGGANNLPGFTSTRVINPGAIEFKSDPSAAGIAVTNATGDLLAFLNSAGGDLIYRLLVWGE